MIVGRTSEEGEDGAKQGLLPCLLCKAASNDKKFIVDAAAATLSVASARVPAELLAPRLLDFVTAKPSLPRGRAAAARALVDVVCKNESSSSSTKCQVLPFFDQLSAVVSELSSDAWPPARQAARDLAAALAKVEKKKKEGEAQPPLASSLAAAVPAPPQSQQQGKENAAAAGAAPSSAFFAPVVPFAAATAGKAVNVVEAPATAAAAAPPQQKRGEHGNGGV